MSNPTCRLSRFLAVRRWGSSVATVRPSRRPVGARSARHRIFSGVWPIIAMVVLVGCRDQVDDARFPDPSGYLAAERPADVMTIPEAVAKLSQPDAAADSADEEGTLQNDQPVEVTIVGRIPGGDLAAIEEKQAVFLMTVLPAEGEGDPGDRDHADNCPFCRRRAEKAPKAIVEILDEATGQVVPHDVRRWLGVETGDHVVTAGTATFDPAVNILTVRTSKLFID